MSLNYYGKKLGKGQILADEQVAWIELKLLFSVISSEKMAKKHRASPILTQSKKH